MKYPREDELYSKSSTQNGQLLHMLILHRTFHHRRTQTFEKNHDVELYVDLHVQYIILCICLCCCHIWRNKDVCMYIGPHLRHRFTRRRSLSR